MDEEDLYKEFMLEDEFLFLDELTLDDLENEGILDKRTGIINYED